MQTIASKSKSKLAEQMICVGKALSFKNYCRNVKFGKSMSFRKFLKQHKLGAGWAELLSSLRAKRQGQKGMRAESSRAVTGRQCPHSGPHSGEGEDFLTRQPGFCFYENGCNSGTESQKIVPKVGNEQSLQGLQTGR